MDEKKKFKRVSEREWNGVLDGWVYSTAEYDALYGGADVDVYESLIQKSSEFRLVGTAKETYIDFPGVRVSMLQEALTLVLKANATLRSMDRDIERDDATFAEVSGYLGSFFLAKAVCLVLGVYVTRKPVNNRYWLVDTAWLGSHYDTSVKCIDFGYNQPGHKEVWGLLRRLVRITKGAPWDQEFAVFINEMNVSDFGRVRNDVSYINGFWTFPDLREEEGLSLDWIKAYGLEVYSILDPEDMESHFGFHFFMVLLRATMCLLGDMGVRVRAIQTEMKNMRSSAHSRSEVLQVGTWIP